MSFPSLHSIRNVVDVFVLKTASMTPTAKFDVEDEHSSALEELERKRSSYDDMIGRVLEDITQEAIPMSDDTDESSFWGDKDVIDMFSRLPRKMLQWMGEELGKKMAYSLNVAFGVYTYKLLRGFGRGSSEDRKTVATFEDKDLHPNTVWSRFAEILKEKTGQDITPEELKSEYTFTKEPKSFYNEQDLKTQPTIRAHTALDETVNLMTKLALNPDLFSDKLAEIRLGKDPATTWVRPPRGKTQSAQEQTNDSDRRQMDPAFANYMFDAIESKKNVRWNYSGIEVSPGKEGESVMMLRAALPGLGKEITLLVPNDIGIAMRDARPGENYTMRVLDYDPSNGFKVSFNDFRDKLRLNAKKSIRKTGVSADQFKRAILSAIREHAKSIFHATKASEVAALAEKYLGRVEVDGKNIATDQGIQDLIDFHENRRSQKDTRGRQNKEQVEDDDRDLTKNFERAKAEKEEQRRQQEESVGEDITSIQHELADHVNKTAEKIADKISRRFPVKAPFTDNMRKWTYVNAFKSRDAIKWLVGIAVDESLAPTKSGDVPWRTLVRGILTSDVLEDPYRTEKLFGKGRFEAVLPALKVALVYSDPSLPKEQKVQVMDQYQKGTLKVTPQDRSAIAKGLAAKGQDSVKKMVEALSHDIAQAFLDMYTEGDPDVVSIVQNSNTRLKSHMKSTEEKGQQQEEPLNKAPEDNLKGNAAVAPKKRKKKKDELAQGAENKTASLYATLVKMAFSKIAR